jgi:hypothetical protein
MNRSVLARQMFANGGQAVPNEYKGFSMLPESVQMKMDPAAAKKYAEGGDVTMDQQRQMENIDALQALRGRAQAQAMGANQYGVPLTGLDDVSRADASKAEDFDPNNIYNIARFFRSNPGAKVSDYNRYFRTNLNPEEFEIFETEAEPVGMAMGGDPAMAQGVGGMMPPDMAPPPSPMPQDQAIDPQVLESALSQAQENLGNIDEAEDYETVINSIRGDDAPISARYQELASVVGEEDAAQTPESVLTLVQPAMVMGAVDQGIGGLAQGAMAEPVQGAMAQGIMSTVEPPQPAMEAGGTPPVNFKEGGLVRRGDNQPVQIYANGGEATPLQTAYEGRLPLYQSIIGDPTAQLEEQKNLTQAQMLFDIAGTALAYAAPMPGERPGMSPAERLAMATTQTKLLPTIGARAQQQLDTKKAATAAEQKMKLGALGAAEADVTAQAKAKAEAALAKQKAEATAVENALNRSADVSKILLQGSVDMENAETKENWRAAAADTTRLAQKEAAALLASNNLAAQEAGKKLQNQLDISKMLLDSELTLDRLGVEDAYKLNQQQIGHGYAMTLQEANLKVTRARDANTTALKLADQELKEAEMLQTANRDASVARINQRKQALEEEKLELDKAARGLETFGKTGKNKAQSILANPKLLEGYAKDTLDETQTTQVSNAIDLLSTKETLPGPDGTTIKTGGSIPEAARLAVIERSKLPKPNDKTRLMPRDVERITAEPLEFGEAVNTLMTSVPDVSVAFGSDAVARNVLNVATEALSFGFAKAPYEATEKAVSAVNQLNLNTLTHFQKVLELRDSVALMNKLEKQTANPKEFLTGDTRAKSKTKTVLDTIDEAVAILDLQIENATDVQEANKHKLAKQRTFQLRAGFEAIERAYEKIGSGGTAITSEIEAEQDSIIQNIFGKNKKVKE